MPAHAEPQDAGEIVRIDRSDDVERMRYVCPNGHTRWNPTNSHVYCRTCLQEHQHGADDISPEHWHVVDKATGEEIAFERVELV